MSTLCRSSSSLRILSYRSSNSMSYTSCFSLFTNIQTDTRYTLLFAAVTLTEFILTQMYVKWSGVTISTNVTLLRQHWLIYKAAKLHIFITLLAYAITGVNKLLCGESHMILELPIKIRLYNLTVLTILQETAETWCVTKVNGKSLETTYHTCKWACK